GISGASHSRRPERAGLPTRRPRDRSDRAFERSVERRTRGNRVRFVHLTLLLACVPCHGRNGSPVRTPVRAIGVSVYERSASRRALSPSFIDGRQTPKRARVPDGV